MRYLNTAYVRSHRARVSHKRGSLLVKSPDGAQRLPLEAIDALILLGSAQITTQALDACVKRGVKVAALQMNGAIRFVVSGKRSGNVHLRTALYAAAMDERRSLELAKVLVAAKLQNSSRVLDRWARDASDQSVRQQLAERATQLRLRLRRLHNAPTAAHVRGVEGDAARIYFRAMGWVVASSGLGFSTRTRRPPRDPVNALLGFCYSMLVTECIGAAESVGLDFQIGFLHRPRAGRPSLALDLAEEMRALVDRFVVAQIRRRQLQDDDFTRTPGGGVYLNDKGRSRLIEGWEQHKETPLRHRVLDRKIGRWALPSIQATLLARHLRGDLPSYPPYVLH